MQQYKFRRREVSKNYQHQREAMLIAPEVRNVYRKMSDTKKIALAEQNKRSTKSYSVLKLIYKSFAFEVQRLDSLKVSPTLYLLSSSSPSLLVSQSLSLFKDIQNLN